MNDAMTQQDEADEQMMGIVRDYATSGKIAPEDNHVIVAIGYLIGMALRGKRG